MRLICPVFVVCSNFFSAAFIFGPSNAQSSQPDSEPDTITDAANNVFNMSTAEVPSTFCQEGWRSVAGKCLYFSENIATLDELLTSCYSLDAKPVHDLNKETFDFIAGVATDTNTEFLLGLKKRRGYGQHFRWFETGSKGVDIYGSTLEEQEVEYAESCAAIFPGTEGYETAYCGDEYNFICERDVDCVPGRFGPNCESECHCLGEPCNTQQGNARCNWGCQPGWTGAACSKPKEKPDVRYFCINSPEEHIGSYVDVHIETHGVTYRSIYAQMANSTKRGPWCQGTRVSEDRDGSDHDHVSITLTVNDTLVDEMRSGKCAGTVVATNEFEWTLVIQEFEGILLDTDIQVLISCNFNTSETLQRTAQAKQSGAQHFSEKIELTPETTDVTLNVVDPFTREAITEAPIGSHVALQIKFGFQEGSLVKGVRPHHCVASCPSGHMDKELLGHNGCSARGSPVSDFQKDKNSTNTISTQWFPLFAFTGHTEVVFKCGFKLCFHSDNCDPGCSTKYSRRSRRSARDMWPDFSPEQDLDWTSSIIRISPDVFDTAPLAEKTAKPNVYEWKHEQLPGRYGLFLEATKAQQPHNEKMEQQDTTPITKETTTTRTTATTATSDLRHKLESEAISMLSPITCGILLLMFLLVTVVFLAFHFNLRRTVEVMRHEMMLQRKSRDRTHYHPQGMRSDGKVCV